MEAIRRFIFWNIVIVGWVFAACADSIVANAIAVVVVLGLLAPLESPMQVAEVLIKELDPTIRIYKAG